LRDGRLPANAAEVPVHTTCPFSMMAWRSASFINASRCLSTRRMAWPSAFRRVRHFQISDPEMKQALEETVESVRTDRSN